MMKKITTTHPNATTYCRRGVMRKSSLLFSRIVCKFSAYTEMELTAKF